MMEKTYPASAPESPKEMEEAIREMFAEMELADERIRRTQIKINRLKAETREILKNIKAV